MYINTYHWHLWQGAAVCARQQHRGFFWLAAAPCAGTPLRLPGAPIFFWIFFCFWRATAPCAGTSLRITGEFCFVERASECARELGVLGVTVGQTRLRSFCYTGNVRGGTSG